MAKTEYILKIKKKDTTTTIKLGLGAEGKTMEDNIIVRLPKGLKSEFLSLCNKLDKDPDIIIERLIENKVDSMTIDFIRKELD